MLLLPDCSCCQTLKLGVERQATASNLPRSTGDMAAIKLDDSAVVLYSSTTSYQPISSLDRLCIRHSHLRPRPLQLRPDKGSLRSNAVLYTPTSQIGGWAIR